MDRTADIIRGLIILVAGLMALGWVMWHWFKNTQDDRGRLVVKWIISALVIGFMLVVLAPMVMQGGIGGAFTIVYVAACGAILAVLWTSNIAGFLARPFGNLFDGGDTPPEPVPLYSMAMARRKQGKFQEAVHEIHKQLDRFPHDVAGQMMLAEIQAEHLNDLPGAQLTIERLCNQPGHAPKSLANALNQLADWHLKFSQDIEAARQALEKIMERAPDSEEARRAAQRIAHLGTTEALLASRDRSPIPVRPGVEHLGLLQDASALKKAELDPAQQAEEHVRHLDQFPGDAEAREKLALLYASHFQRLDLAVEQLELLIQQPHHAAKQVAHWLHLLADLQVQYAANYDAARDALQRIIDLYPGLAPAEIAQQRLHHLKLELKGKEKSQVVQLGSYEQDLGLKKR